MERYIVWGWDHLAKEWAWHATCATQKSARKSAAAYERHHTWRHPAYTHIQEVRCDGPTDPTAGNA